MRTLSTWVRDRNCLNDLSWIEGPRILLIHEDLPLEPTPDEAAQYLELIGHDAY